MDSLRELVSWVLHVDEHLKVFLDQYGAWTYALLFVMFDVEAVFIFPWAVRLAGLGTFALVEMVVFVVILALGLVYAWRKNVLRWV